MASQFPLLGGSPHPGTDRPSYRPGVCSAAVELVDQMHSAGALSAVAERLPAQAPTLPSAYANLEVAQRRHQDRAQKYLALLRQSDPVADAVLDAFSAMPEERW